MEGIVTGNNGVFLVPQNEAKRLGLEPEIVRECVRGREIRRFTIEPPEDVVIYPYRLQHDKTVPLPEADISEFPNVWEYLNQNRGRLSGREYFDQSSKLWYELWCPRDIRLLGREKILVAELAESNRFALAGIDQYFGDTVCGIIPNGHVREDICYLIALLNSRLLEYYYKRTTVPKANRFYIYKTMFLKRIPIRIIDFADSEDTNAHGQIVALTRELTLQSSLLTKAGTPHEKEAHKRQIRALEDEVNQIVYQLYGLNEKEIMTIEGSLK